MSIAAILLAGGSTGPAPVNGGTAVFVTPGTYTWTVPEGVTSVCAVVIGGGASGADASAGVATAGGAGGGLVWANDIEVTPGGTFEVVVAAATPGASNATARRGALSRCQYVPPSGPGLVLLAYGGGTGSTGSAGNATTTGGGASIADSSGGLLIKGTTAVHAGGTGAANVTARAGGGGGAAGYTSDGSSAATTTSGSPTTTMDGGRGGVYWTATSTGFGGAGGGVNVYGSHPTPEAASSGGSYGGDGAPAAAAGTGKRDGGAFGGGGGGSYHNYNGGAGARGAVRIMWGAGRSFPNNAKEPIAITGTSISDSIGTSRLTSALIPAGASYVGVLQWLEIKAYMTTNPDTNPVKTWLRFDSAGAMQNQTSTTDPGWTPISFSTGGTLHNAPLSVTFAASLVVGGVSKTPDAHFPVGSRYTVQGRLTDIDGNVVITPELSIIPT
jgi:hypothetical protein